MEPGTSLAKGCDFTICFFKNLKSSFIKSKICCLKYLQWLISHPVDIPFLSLLHRFSVEGLPKNCFAI